MGRVRTKLVKKAARSLIEKYYPRLTLDFHTNKRICDEVAMIPSKSLRNKIAGFVTHLMKRIQKGPVRGISFKLQEEERERRDNYVPEVSETAVEKITIDAETQAMLKAMGVAPKGLVVQRITRPQVTRQRRQKGKGKGKNAGKPRQQQQKGERKPRQQQQQKGERKPRQQKAAAPAKRA